MLEMKMNSSWFCRSLLYLMLFPFVLALTGCQLQQSLELSQNREKWDQQHLTNYHYKVSIISQWGINDSMPFFVLVKDGKPFLILDKNGNDVTAIWQGNASIEAMFEEIQTALSRKNRKVIEIRYDPNYGFPQYFDIFYNEHGVGGEYDRYYTVSDFEMEPSP